MSSSSSSAEKKLFTLMSSDGEIFEVEMAVAVESKTVKHLIEDICGYGPIPLPNVTGPILSKVIEYIKKHIEPGATGNKEEDEETLSAWDTEFVKLDQQTLLALILAANYLNIKSLLDLTCQTVANMIKGKSVNEIRKTFNIKNDFTVEEEEMFQRENQWAFE